MTELPPLVIEGPREQGELLIGVIDVMMGIGVAIANAGLLERADIVAAMDRVLEQQRERDGRATPAAQFPATALRAVFAASVLGAGETEARRRRDALRVIDRDDGPPAA